MENICRCSRVIAAIPVGIPRSDRKRSKRATASVYARIVLGDFPSARRLRANDGVRTAISGDVEMLLMMRGEDMQAPFPRRTEVESRPPHGAPRRIFRRDYPAWERCADN